MVPQVESMHEVRISEKMTEQKNPTTDAPQAYAGLVALFGAILDQARASLHLNGSAPSPVAEAVVPEVSGVQDAVESVSAGSRPSGVVSGDPSTEALAVAVQKLIPGDDAQPSVPVASSEADGAAPKSAEDVPDKGQDLRALFVRALVRQQAQGLSDRHVAAPSAQGQPAAILVSPGSAENVVAVQPAQTPGATSLDLPQPEIVEVRQLGNFSLRTVRYLAGRSGEIVSVRLVPQSLGELQIAVRSSPEGLEVVLTASTHAARELLESRSLGLRDTLLGAGLEVSKVTVQTTAGGDLGPGQSGHGRLATSGRGAEPAATPAEERSEFLEQAREAPYRAPGHEGYLNMLV